MWIISILIVLAAVMIFISTLTINPKHKDLDAWVKVKLKRNANVMASWCRVIPGRGVRFYTLDGDMIDQEKERVSIIEQCLDSNISHPIPRDEISELLNGNIGDSWSSQPNPFNCRN